METFSTEPETIGACHFYSPPGEYSISVTVTEEDTLCQEANDGLPVLIEECPGLETASLAVCKVDEQSNSQPGVEITIDGPSRIVTGTTGVDGCVSLVDIPTGDYTVGEMPSSGYRWESISGDCTNANPAQGTVGTVGASCAFHNSEIPAETPTPTPTPLPFTPLPRCANATITVHVTECGAPAAGLSVEVHSSWDDSYGPTTTDVAGETSFSVIGGSDRLSTPV